MCQGLLWEQGTTGEHNQLNTTDETPAFTGGLLVGTSTENKGNRNTQSLGESAKCYWEKSSWDRGQAFSGGGGREERAAL